MPPFRELYGLSGAVVGAVDLVRGIGRLAGLDVIDVPGATGDLDTDYGAKARAAVAALADHDLVWVHVEAPGRGRPHGRPAREGARHRARGRRGARADPAASARARRCSWCPTTTRRCARARTPAGPVPFVISESLPGAGGGGAMAYGESQAATTGLVRARRAGADAAVPRGDGVRTAPAASAAGGRRQARAREAMAAA